MINGIGTFVLILFSIILLSVPDDIGPKLFGAVILIALVIHAACDRVCEKLNQLISTPQKEASDATD